jgi:hypothetical protein
MKSIRKIQPKSPDIDLDFLAHRIREGNKPRGKEEEEEEEDTTPEVPIEKLMKPRGVSKSKTPSITQTEVAAAPPKKKAGRRKVNVEEMHRFAIDLPEWLFEKIRHDAETNFSTVRGQILKLLLAHYKN